MTYQRNPCTLLVVVLEFCTVILLEPPCSSGAIEVDAGVVRECCSLRFR